MGWYHLVILYNTVHPEGPFMSSRHAAICLPHISRRMSIMYLGFPSTVLIYGNDLGLSGCPGHTDRFRRRIVKRRNWKIFLASQSGPSYILQSHLRHVYSSRKNCTGNITLTTTASVMLENIVPWQAHNKSPRTQTSANDVGVISNRFDCVRNAGRFGRF